MSDPVTPEASAETTEPVQLSDADLRLWAKDNGIEGVPTAGMLSAAWREQILAAMAAAADAEAEAPEEGASVTEPSPDASAPAISEEEAVEAAPEAPAEETVPTEYRTPYVAPSTWVSGQYYTAGF